MYNTGKLLFDEAPLTIQPTLAKLIGLNEAIVVQQLHYWLKKSTNSRDGRMWVYNTYKEWQEQFPFWSEITVRRTLTALEKKGIIVTGNYNAMKADQTKWYSIDYEKLDSMISPCDQNDQSMRSKRSDACDQNDQSNTREYTENTTENNIIPFSEIIDYLNQQVGTSFRASSKQTKKCITARWNEGYTLDDFKKVIDNKVAQWIDDPKMSPYLKPDTLFSNKFEGYLHQKSLGKGGGSRANGTSKGGLNPDREQQYRDAGID